MLVDSVKLTEDKLKPKLTALADEEAELEALEVDGLTDEENTKGGKFNWPIYSKNLKGQTFFRHSNLFATAKVASNGRGRSVRF